MTEAGLRLWGVAQRFRGRWVLRGVDLEIGAGEIVAIVGRNGSGKTTLLRICATLLRPTRGGGELFGLELLSGASSLRGRIGLLGHSSGLYLDLTAAENLRFALRMRGSTAAASAIEAVLERVALRDAGDRRVREFSAGMRRRLALARSLLDPPDLLLLDEPYASFDADGIGLVNDFAQEIAEWGGIVLVATHDLARGGGTLTRVVRLRDGKAVEDVERVEST